MFHVAIRRGARRAAIQVEVAAPESNAVVNRTEFDEVSGNFAPSVGSVTGVANGTIEYSLDRLVSAGGGTSIALDGSTAYVEYTHDSSLAVPYPSFNFYFQIDKLPTSSTKYVLFSKDRTNLPGGVSLEARIVGSTLRLTGYKRDGSGVPLAFNDALDAGVADLAVDVAYQVTMSTGEGVTRLYLDKIEVGSIPDDTGWEDNDERAVLGAYSGAFQDKLDGVLDRLDIGTGPYDAAQLAATPDAVTISHPDTQPPAETEFACATNTNISTAFKNQGTVFAQRSLGDGGNRTYDMRGSIGDHNYDSGSNTYDPNISVRFTTAHNGGCVFGGIIRDSYAFGIGNPRRYPSNSGSTTCVFWKNLALTNYTINGIRFYNIWDGPRVGQGAGATNGVFVKACWFTNVFDDMIENDNYGNDVSLEDCLCEKLFVLYSCRNPGTTDGSSKVETVRDCLCEIHEMYDSSYNNRQFQFFKLKSQSPRFDLFDNIFFVYKAGTGPGNGDPFHDLLFYNKLRNSSGNTIVWTGGGAYPFTMPSGFTVVTTLSTWTNAVSAWKTDHPYVERVPEDT